MCEPYTNVPSPNVRATAHPTQFFDALSGANVLNPMIPTKSGRNPINRDRTLEQVQDRVAEVVITCSEASDKTGMPVDEAVKNDAPADEA